MNGSLRDMLVQAGPHQDKEGNFPRDKEQRKLSVAHYKDGERGETKACLFQAKRCSLLFLMQTFFTRVQICSSQGRNRGLEESVPPSQLA